MKTLHSTLLFVALSAGASLAKAEISGTLLGFSVSSSGYYSANASVANSSATDCIEYAEMGVGARVTVDGAVKDMVYDVIPVPCWPSELYMPEWLAGQVPPAPPGSLICVEVMYYYSLPPTQIPLHPPINCTLMS